MVRQVLKLEVKGRNIIKGISFEGFSKICDIKLISEKLNSNNYEVFLVDNTRSYFGLEPNFDALQVIAEQITSPITFGGGLRTFEHVNAAFNRGASRIYINSAFEMSGISKLINKVQLTYGAQSIVGGLEVQSFDDLTPMFNGGRDYTSLNFNSKLNMYRDYKITELILTNIFADGTFTANPKHYKILSETFDLNCIIGGGLTEFLDTSREFSGSFLSSGAFKNAGLLP